MEVYVDDLTTSHEPEQIVESLKKAFLSGVPGLEDRNYFLPMQSQSWQEFLLKDFQSIVWGKVFFEPVSEEARLSISDKIRDIRRYYEKRIRPVLFVPQGGWMGKALEGEFFATYFEYSFLRSPSHPALRIRSISPEPAALKKAAIRMESPSQLTRDELSDLIELSLRIK